MREIIIDTETYRKRREDSLVAMAKELGEKARRTQKPITVSHMNAHNRRIIHMALQNEETDGHGVFLRFFLGSGLGGGRRSISAARLVTQWTTCCCSIPTMTGDG